jgi:hypothetical protein
MFSEAQLEQVKAVSLIWVFFGLSALLIWLVGAILLFMLRKAGFYLLAADAAIQSLSACWRLERFQCGWHGEVDFNKCGNCMGYRHCDSNILLAPLH